LVALAVGALERRELSDRCAVWSEREMVDKAKYEFGETEDYLRSAEVRVCLWKA
jgi:leukotriene-A4 hydrolase